MDWSDIANNKLQVASEISRKKKEKLNENKFFFAEIKIYVKIFMLFSKKKKEKLHRNS